MGAAVFGLFSSAPGQNRANGVHLWIFWLFLTPKRNDILCLNGPKACFLTAFVGKVRLAGALGDFS